MSTRSTTNGFLPTEMRFKVSSSRSKLSEDHSSLIPFASPAPYRCSFSNSQSTLTFGLGVEISHICASFFWYALVLVSPCRFAFVRPT
ncbi:hypothetical protein OG21DRAFT_1506460 [Imleria badia]|nr:hypothetical protein OG21DRAFT_1506460 [Imleria badia]